MIDFQGIIEDLQLYQVKNILEQLQIPFRETDTALIMPTVCHNEDVETASWKLYYYKNSHFFYCYTECSEAMSIFKFLQRFYETRGIEYDWYKDIFLLITDGNYNNNKDFESIKYQSQKERLSKHTLPRLPKFSTSVLDVFQKTYPPEWLEDGISTAAMDKYNILYSISQNKIIIPHYNVDGDLVGIRGRALDEWEVENIGKYAPVKIEQTWYKHPLSLNLYGLNITKDNIRKHGICFLGESEKFCLQFDSFSLPNCSAAVCGSNLNKHVLKILLKECHPREIVICFDKEEKQGEERYFNKLWNICKKYSQYCNFSFIYDRENLLSMKDSPTDKGEEVFEKLLRKRVMVK